MNIGKKGQMCQTCQIGKTDKIEYIRQKISSYRKVRGRTTYISPEGNVIMYSRPKARHDYGKVAAISMTLGIFRSNVEEYHVSKVSVVIDCCVINTIFSIPADRFMEMLRGSEVYKIKNSEQCKIRICKIGDKFYIELSGKDKIEITEYMIC